MQITLLPLNESYLEKVRNWRMSTDVTTYMYTDPIITIDEQKKWYNQVKSDSTKKFWIINVDTIDVGLISLYDFDVVNKRCFWAYYLADPSVRGKGIGKAIELNILKFCFLNMGLNKVCCEVLSTNEKVVEIHKKYGSKIEGLFREHIIKNGQKLDVVRMGILRTDWEKDIQPNFEIPDTTFIS